MSLGGVSRQKNETVEQFQERVRLAGGWSAMANRNRIAQENQSRIANEKRWAEQIEKDKKAEEERDKAELKAAAKAIVQLLVEYEKEERDDFEKKKLAEEL
jgi:hypothetical protein